MTRMTRMTRITPKVTFSGQSKARWPKVRPRSQPIRIVVRIPFLMIITVQDQQEDEEDADRQFKVLSQEFEGLALVAFGRRAS